VQGKREDTGASKKWAASKPVTWKKRLGAVNEPKAPLILDRGKVFTRHNYLRAAKTHVNAASWDKKGAGSTQKFAVGGRAR